MSESASVAQFTVEPLPHRVFRHYHQRAAWIALTDCSARCVFCTSGHIAVAPDRLPSVIDEGGDVSDQFLTWRHQIVEQTPDELVSRAVRHGCTVMYFSFSEPMYRLDFLIACARLAQQRGLAVIIDTNGINAPAEIGRVAPLLTAVYVGIKGSLSPAFYLRRMRVDPSAVETVQRAIVAWRDSGVELAVSDIVEPPHWQPDDDQAAATLQACYGWLAETVDTDTPLDIRPMFHPRNYPPTRLLPRTASTADVAAFDRRYTLAREIARECGLTLGDDFRRLWKAA